MSASVSSALKAEFVPSGNRERDPTSSREPTTSVEARVIRELRGSSYPEVRAISCDWNGHGTITLRGIVPSFYLKQVALCAISGLRKMEGVDRIRNEIVVNPR